jgi:hypothetical protein
MECGR